MYSAKEIAKYILDYSEDRDVCINNMRLQKLLYFVQAAFLIEKNRKCFDDDIVAHDSGPIVPEVREEYSWSGVASIPSDGTSGKYYEILEEDVPLIQNIVQHFEKYSTTQLVQITTDQLPWKKGRAWARDWVIDPEWIKEYFEES